MKPAAILLKLSLELIEERWKDFRNAFSEKKLKHTGGSKRGQNMSMFVHRYQCSVMA